MTVKLKIKKSNIFIIFCLVVVVAVTGIFIFNMSQRENVREALKLGNKYLSNLDYESAIREYGKILQVEPLNEEALIGLAKGYAGIGDYEMVNYIFENELSDSDNMDVLRSQAEILVKKEDYVKAAEVISQIIDVEDKEEDYQWLEEVLTKVLDKKYEYAESNDVVITVENGKVFSKGSNVLGALGTLENIGNVNVSDTLKSAAFNGTAKSVFTTGANSYVIDENNALYVAGSNRSGQKANNSTEMLPSVDGFRKDALEGVVKTAGFSSSVFALTDDARLWFCGANMGFVEGAAWRDEWTLIGNFGRILDVQCNGGSIAILTIEGDVYRCLPDSYYLYHAQTLWSHVAENAEAIALNQYGELVYLKNTGEVEGYGFSVYTPADWTVVYDEWGYQAGSTVPFGVKNIALSGSAVYLLADSGELYLLKDGSCTKVAVPVEIENIYTSGSNCVVQNAAGGFLTLDELGNVK